MEKNAYLCTMVKLGIVTLHMAEGVTFFVLGMVAGYALCCIIRNAVNGRGR